MSLSKFHSNGILTGAVDSCCLLCESHLRSEDEIIAHITEARHQRNRGATPYAEKFKHDNIRKVKKGYFCEFCNLLLSTAAKVGLHVADPSHVRNKGMLMLKRAGNAVMAFDNILISESAWHGIIDDTCVICNTEFESELSHKRESSHILNLVQSKFEFFEDNSVYRKVDDSSFHCLICNLVLALNVVTTHFDQTSHKTMLANCKEFNSTTSSTNDVFANTMATRSTMLENKKPITKSEIKYVPPSEPAKKQNAKATKDPPAQNVLDQIVCDADREICKALGAENYITSQDHGKNWCILCDWTMDPVVTSHHIQSRHHQTLLKLHKDRLQLLSNQSDKTTKSNKKSDANQEKGTTQETEEKVDYKSKILKHVTEFQKQDMKINFENSIATCRKCTQNVDFEFDAIDKHIQEHKDKYVKAPVPSSIDEKKLPVTKIKKERSMSITSRENIEEAEKFAKDHHLVYSRETAHCLVCYVKVPPNIKNMQEHINGSSHKNLAAKQTIVNKPTEIFASKSDSNSFVKQEIIDPSRVIDNKFQILQSVNEFRKQNVSINFTSSTATCSKCSKDIEFELNAINEHITEHKSNEDIKAPVAETLKNGEKKSPVQVVKTNARSPSTSSKDNNEVAEKFAKDNNLVFGREAANCLVCNVKIPPSLKNMQEHVNGSSHKNMSKHNTKKSPVKKLNVETKKPVIEKKSLESFISSSILLENGEMKHIILNLKICINVFSFLMLSKVNYKPVCFACDMTLSIDEITAHSKTKTHEKLIKQGVIVTSFDTEFIREIRPEVFHCGFCNSTVVTWEDLKEHLTTNNHRECKTNASFTLTSYMPDIIQHRERKEMEAHILLNMLGNGSLLF